MEASRHCDIGLSLFPLESSDQNILAMPGASNKSFDYLACGLPVIVSDISAWREFLVLPGFGLACDPASPASIATAIMWLIDHPEQMRKMGDSGRRRILSDWNYDRCFRPVFDYLSMPSRSAAAGCEAARSI
jgi:glycosyltransferase involved in cell wall biosynthesis